MVSFLGNAVLALQLAFTPAAFEKDDFDVLRGQNGEIDHAANMEACREGRELLERLLNRYEEGNNTIERSRAVIDSIIAITPDDELQGLNDALEGFIILNNENAYKALELAEILKEHGRFLEGRGYDSGECAIG